MIITTAKGKQLNVAALMAANATTPAIGNASMNARGDLIARDGAIVKRREQIASDYYTNSPTSVQQVSLSSLQADVVDPATALQQAVDAGLIAPKKSARTVPDKK